MCLCREVIVDILEAYKRAFQDWGKFMTAVFLVCFVGSVQVQVKEVILGTWTEVLAFHWLSSPLSLHHTYLPCLVLTMSASFLFITGIMGSRRCSVQPSRFLKEKGEQVPGRGIEAEEILTDITGSRPNKRSVGSKCPCDNAPCVVYYWWADSRSV